MAKKKATKKPTQGEIAGTGEKPTGPILKATKIYEERREANAEAKEEFKQAKEALIKLMDDKGVTFLKGNGWEITRGALDTIRVKNLEDDGGAKE